MTSEEKEARRQSLFWAKVKKGTKPLACWEWLGTIPGAPQFRDGDLRVSAGWYALKLAGVNPQRGAPVVRLCRNHRCVKPAHLDVGQAALAEAIRRTRSRLTWDDVRKIRRMYADGETQAVLAKRFCVSQSAISQIVIGAHWHGDGSS